MRKVSVVCKISCFANRFLLKKYIALLSSRRKILCCITIMIGYSSVQNFTFTFNSANTGVRLSSWKSLKRRPFELDGCNRRRKPAFSSAIDGHNGCCGRRGISPGDIGNPTCAKYLCLPLALSPSTIHPYYTRTNGYAVKSADQRRTLSCWWKSVQGICVLGDLFSWSLIFYGTYLSCPSVDCWSMTS